MIYPQLLIILIDFYIYIYNKNVFYIHIENGTKIGYTLSLKKMNQILSQFQN